MAAGLAEPNSRLREGGGVSAVLAVQQQRRQQPAAAAAAHAAHLQGLEAPFELRRQPRVRISRFIYHIPPPIRQPPAPCWHPPRPGPRIARLRRQEDLLPSQRPRLKMTLQHRPLRKQPVRSIRRNDFRCGDCVCAYDRRLGPVPLGRVEVPYNLEPPQLMSRGTLEMKLWEVAREGGRTYDSLR